MLRAPCQSPGTKNASVRADKSLVKGTLIACILLCVLFDLFLRRIQYVCACDETSRTVIFVII